MAQRIIDLTLTFRSNMPVQSEFQAPIYATLVSHDDGSRMGLGAPGDPFTPSWKYLGLVEHTATHVDAYLHMGPDGESIDQMPIDLFFGPAVCLDLTHIPDSTLITVEDMEAAESQAGVAIDGHIVLLATGLHRRYYPDPILFNSMPGLSAEATHWLADRGSRLHGVEGPSTDIMKTKEFPNHRVCRDRKISHYEWLINLEELIGKGEFTFYGVPLKLDGGTGAPVRAYAIIEE